MRTYNLSPTKDNYYSQRNNEIDPSVTCKPTSTIECLDLAGWPMPFGGFHQPEDYLTSLCRSDAGKQALARFSPKNKTDKPNEDWHVIKWALSVIYKSKPVISDLRWDWTLKEALFGITKGKPFACSTWLTKGGHVVSLVGFETEQTEDIPSLQALDMTKVRAVIIDDPYGNRLAKDGYLSGESGWNNRYSIGTWADYWRGIGLQINKASPC